MKYAVIKTGGKQYQIEEGEEILVDRLKEAVGDKIEFPEVLMVRDKDKVLIGDPLLKNAQVNGKVIEEVKGEKIKVAKFKAKVRYRKTIGFKPLYSKVVIESIEIGAVITSKAKVDKRQTKKSSSE